MPSRNVPDASMAVPLGIKRTHEDSDDERLSYPKRMKFTEVPQPKTAAASSDGFTYMGNCYMYISYIYSISQKGVHPSYFCKYFIISFHVTTLKK